MALGQRVQHMSLASHRKQERPEPQFRTPGSPPPELPNHAWIVEEGLWGVNVTSVMRPLCRKSPFAGSFCLRLEWPRSGNRLLNRPAVATI
jgi:hypothetical protein